MTLSLSLSLSLAFALQASQWEELILKAKEMDKPVDGLVHNHVHQLHGLVAGTEYELAIESMNKFGWSRPLVEKFTTLPHLDSKLFSCYQLTLPSLNVMPRFSS